ncbi:MAG: putative metallopeptidase [Myxococcaceae bacterium]|nr:putative metallopeptidase [Myxococcaceae bacterium]
MTKRPDFTASVRRLMAHVAATTREFRHLDPDAILVVSGEARRASRGTVKPLCFPGGRRRDAMGRRKPLVTYQGHRVLYAITLRPLFFRRSTPRQRVATILHELFHISPAFDGTLDHRRRHAHAGEGFEAEFAPVERRCWKRLPPELVEAFAYDGEVRVLQWLEKPQSWLPGERASHRTHYTEAHLFEGVVRMKTPQPRRRREST